MKGFDEHQDNYGNPGLSTECQVCGLHHEPMERITTVNGEFDIPEGLLDLGYSWVECAHCQSRIWGTPDDIDSGYRKHLDNYCSMRPKEEP